LHEFVSIEMRQHLGAPGEPLVNVGDKVKKGQLIASSDWVNIHSSVYGEVAKVSSQAVTMIPDAHQPEEYVKIKETDTLIEAIKEAGVVGAGGAGFPAHIKYRANLEGGYVILNAAECEPVLNHNMCVLQEQPDAIVRGIKYAMEITGAAKGIIAIKPKNTKELVAIAKACKGEESIEIKYLSDRYPSGDERVIIRELLGVYLKPGQLPLEAKAIVSNVETIKRIVEAIELRKPVITKDFTVAGRLKDIQGTCRVYLDQPIGASVKKYIDDCGGYLEPYGEIMIGGPFTGKSGNEQSTVTKIMGGIFVGMPFPVDTRKFGILACECGGDEERLREIAAGMNADVVADAMCKRMVEVGGRFRCDEPGSCPGQAEAILGLKAKGAEVVLVGSCED
jgi:proline reductase-associated electron transfer protein PrdC